jgi:hypothetical protein
MGYRYPLEDSVALVRPDGFVAWRSQSACPTLAALGAAVDTALWRQPRAPTSPAGSA